MPQPVKDAANLIALATAIILVIGILAMILSQTACIFGWSKLPSFCTPEALVGRRDFFLQVIAALGALWGALKLVEKS